MANCQQARLARACVVSHPGDISSPSPVLLTACVLGNFDKKECSLNRRSNPGIQQALQPPRYAPAIPLPSNSLNRWGLPVIVWNADQVVYRLGLLRSVFGLPL